MAEHPDWSRARLALTLLAIDPAGLGGLVLRARPGPAREAFTGLFHVLPLPQTRLHPMMTDEALFGGMDLSATLASGHLRQSKGLLHDPSALILAMAERCPAELAARLCATLDAGAGHCLVALDEGAEPDESTPPALAERLAFHVDLTDVAAGDVSPREIPTPKAARAQLHDVAIPGEALTTIATLAARLGIDSLRAPIFTLRAARANAALFGRDRVEAEDIEAAAQLTLAHRATELPEAPPDDHPQDTPDDTDKNRDSGTEETLDIPDELLLDAIRAVLPEGLLDPLKQARARTASGSGAGARKKGNRRGRPLPSRPGRATDGARIDIVATLRAAAPWQTIRRAEQPNAARPIHIRHGDLRYKRYEDRSDRLLIFTVDASGSAALARLAEAKGAVELLLAQAYARRDHVALIAFRGLGAEVLLPPTRSLVQTKRRLAALPGGGGTPLAAGLVAAMELAGHATRKGLTPTLALLTDGRANITLEGTANRAQASEDACRIAETLRRQGIDAIVIDTGTRPEQTLSRLAETLGATYLPLPRADARRLSDAVTSALDA